MEGVTKMKKGFTLIELLITIAIIGILASIGLATYPNVQKLARDGSRKSDLGLIQSGLELYKADCNSYPSSLGTQLTGSPPPTSCSSSNVYINAIPTDPVSGRLYTYTVTATGYEMCAALEKDGSTVTCTGSCGSGITCNYKVTNP